MQKACGFAGEGLMKRARGSLSPWRRRRECRPDAQPRGFAIAGQICALLVAGLAGIAATESSAHAATYYVDATGGSDVSDGLTQGTAWKSIAKVNGSTFSAGDTILFKRGEVWRESLVPPSSGVSGSPITFDAYGSGEAPTITGAQDLPSAAWTQDSGNLWKATVAATGMNYVSFGGMWGLKHTTSKTECVAPRDFFFYTNTLYVYSVGNPASYYGPVAAMLMTNGQLVYVNGKSWITIQHFRLTYYDAYGLRIGGASDHVTVANIVADGIIPAGTLPHGFYVNASPNPGDINFYNDEAHRNYDGFRIAGGAALVRVKNCRGYANRNYGLEDSTSATNYSYSHFYGNGVGVLLSTDVSGGVDGGNNKKSSDGLWNAWPAVHGFQKYPARITLTIDDPGLVAGEDSYVDSMLPVFDSRGVKLSIAVVAGYATGILPKIQSWLGDGQDINSHSWSHQYYTNLGAFTLQYTGTGTAATVSVSGNHLTTTVTGGPGGENLNLDLASAAYDTMSELVATINGRSVYTAVQDGNCQGVAHSIGLADVATQSIKGSAYLMQLQKDRLVPDEMSASKAWLQSNVSGLSNVKVYVYPAGIEDATTQGWAVTAGYEGARGGLAMGPGVKEVYSWGVNLQDITSLGISGLHNLTQQQIAERAQALVFKSSVWGVPYGLFFHNQELTTTEVGDLLDAVQAAGATVMTNTQLADWIAGTSRIGTGTYYVTAATGPEVDLRPTSSSPVVNGGADLGSSFAYDLEGVDQRVFGSGWEIGAYAYIGQPTFVVVVE